jgi:hypothetical protein
MKMTLPTAWTVATIAQGALEFPLGYKYHKQWGTMQANLRHATDFLLKAHYNASDWAPYNILAAQVGLAGWPAGWTPAAAGAGWREVQRAKEPN